MELICIMTTLYLIRQQRSLKLFENLSSSFFLTQHIIHFSPHLIIILLDSSKIGYVNADLQTIRGEGHCAYVALCAMENILRGRHQEAHGPK